MLARSWDIIIDMQEPSLEVEIEATNQMGDTRFEAFSTLDNNKIKLIQNQIKKTLKKIKHISQNKIKLYANRRRDGKVTASSSSAKETRIQRCFSQMLFFLILSSIPLINIIYYTSILFVVFFLTFKFLII